MALEVAAPNASSTLDEWLAYQTRVHPRGIALGLERVGEVWRRLGAPAPAATVISVAGTNGKGSTVAFLDAMLSAAGKRVGTFTSPHLSRYNERVRVGGAEVGDDLLVDAFARIEAARGEIALTYFEFGTLAALLVFAQSALDVAVLEVGLGGRLDAVNIIDADAAIVTTIDLDHQDWLGDDRARIAREKAGIYRAGRPAIIGDANAPPDLLECANAIGADAIVAARDYHVEVLVEGWRWQHGDEQLLLPDPALVAPIQRANAASAIAALSALRARLGWHPQALADGLRKVRLAARMQRFAGRAELLIDVAHNPQAASVLAAWLAANPASGRVIAVFAALGDKDVHGIVAPLLRTFTEWTIAGLDGDSPRGLDAGALRARAAPLLDAMKVSTERHVDDALRSAWSQAASGDRVVAFGSFFVASAALQFAARERLDEI